MTVKEITNKIKHILEELSYPSAVAYLTLNDKKWLKAAIKALEQEPCDNAISRKLVKTEYKRRLESSLKDEFRGLDLTHLADCTRFNEFIDSIPPVNPQPKTGYWIFVDKAHEHAHCSECDYGNVDLLDGRPHNYCPNCGCRMVEPMEGSE